MFYEGQEDGQIQSSTQFCFPHINLSCVKHFKPEKQNIIFYIFISAISVLTVFLNLLVIISISHFKKLHTPTNLLILSLAVADLIVGLIVMPVQGVKLIDSCWYFGDTFCMIFPYLLYVICTASLGNLILISVDRYIALTDPLRYPVRVTNNITVFCIIVIWLWSVIFCNIILNDAMFSTNSPQTCLGECTFAIKFKYFITDLVFSFIGPCSAILSLYLKIFCIAKQQAQNLTSGRNKEGCFEDKAARTISFVVSVYLLCYIPYCLTVLSQQDQSDQTVVNIMYWITCINSTMNPIIYALFYRWFRVSAKLILTLKICEPLSDSFNLLPDGE